MYPGVPRSCWHAGTHKRVFVEVGTYRTPYLSPTNVCDECDGFRKDEQKTKCHTLEEMQTCNTPKEADWGGSAPPPRPKRKTHIRVTG